MVSNGFLNGFQMGVKKNGCLFLMVLLKLRCFLWFLDFLKGFLGLCFMFSRVRKQIQVLAKGNVIVVFRCF